MPSATLADRAIVEVSGPDAAAFLDRLVTSSVVALEPGAAGFGALLTPQGKIIADFVVFAIGSAEAPRFWLDVPAGAAADLAKRLGLYRLRAKVAVADRSADLAVQAGWSGAPVPEDAKAHGSDPRLAELGWRAVMSGPARPDGDAAGYHAHRIALGVPESVHDFALGDAFPHEAMMDGLAGVDFRKGCYVGQEVVSRMQHRGTARTRIVPALYDGPPPPARTEIRAGDRAIGTTGSVAGSRGMASVRLDRLADALAAGDVPQAGGVRLRVEKPSWVTFDFPGAVAVSAA